MPKYALLELTKEKWEKLKKDADMKKKGALSKFFTKLTGANVGDHIKKFAAAHKVMGSALSATTVKNAFKAASDLEKSLRKYAAEKAFATEEAKEFKRAVITWADDANSYATDLAAFYKDNEDALKANDAAFIIDRLHSNGLL